MENWFIHAHWYEVAIGGWLYFTALYVGMGLLTLFMTGVLLPAIGHGGVLDRRPMPSGQLRRELLLSQASIALFGIGMVFPWALVQSGWASFVSDPSAPRIALEVVALLLWNEVYFYFNHRLLHTRMLRRFHAPHHRSVITTPWTTYSFHPVEALLLGNVMIPPMLVHDFSFTALALLPVFSLLFNNIGHSNYDFLPGADRDRWWMNGSRRHHLHHACFGGNYGFMLPFMDRFCGTDLKADAADARINP